MRNHATFLVTLLLSAFAAPAYAAGWQWTEQEFSLIQGAIATTTLLKHILPMIILAFWAVQRPKGETWILIGIWILCVAIGTFLGMSGNQVVGGQLLQTLLMVSLFVLGVIVAVPLKLNIGMAIVIAGFFAIIHGFAISEVAPVRIVAMLYILGAAVGSFVLIGVGLLVASMVKEKAPMLPQIGGAVGAGMGLAVLFSLQRFFA